MTGLFSMPPLHAGVATTVANRVIQVPGVAAHIFGGAVRQGLQSAGVTQADVQGELHRLEAEAGIVALVGLAIIVGGAIIWSKV